MKTIERGAIWQTINFDVNFFFGSSVSVINLIPYYFLQAIEEIDISEKAVAAAVNETIESAGVNVSLF